MEKFMSKYACGKEIEDQSKILLSLYEQRDVLLKTAVFIKKLDCTENGEKVRKQLMVICKTRITRINNKITETNDRIYRLQQQEAVAPE